jgi:glycosyltransferase involved in cell wall biosynthesis
MDKRRRDVSIGFVSTYPPTVCGLASFTNSLVRAISRNRHSGAGLGVVDVGTGSHGTTNRQVVHRHQVGDASSVEVAKRVLNTYDTVSIQHEFGIFGGRDGDEIVELISGLRVPTAVTLHTVLSDPSQHQRWIIDTLAAHADRMVVMSETASDRLVQRYQVDPERVAVIPHGADDLFARPSLVTGDRPLVLTWGLIGPGKGLEGVIEAFAGLKDLVPRPRYLIAGATHPNVLESHGESYRESLVSLVRHNGLEEMVEFDDRYLDRDSLARMVRSADLVVLPYASVEQVTSGVLVEAIAAAKPVIATRFPHAVELLSAGAGITVAHGDPVELRTALRRLLTDSGLMSRMGREARELAEGWDWAAVGDRFDTMVSGIARAPRHIGPAEPLEIARVAG